MKIETFACDECGKRRDDDWHSIDSGEWYAVNEGREYRVACCDCGLVHVLEFRIGGDGRVNYRVRRDEPPTVSP